MMTTITLATTSESISDHESLVYLISEYEQHHQQLSCSNGSLHGQKLWGVSLLLVVQ